MQSRLPLSRGASIASHACQMHVSQRQKGRAMTYRHTAWRVKLGNASLGEQLPCQYKLLEQTFSLPHPTTYLHRPYRILPFELAVRTPTKYIHQVINQTHGAPSTKPSPPSYQEHKLLQEAAEQSKPNKMPDLHVNHKVSFIYHSRYLVITVVITDMYVQMHQYTLIPRVLYLRRWGKRLSLSFGRSGRVSYG